MALTVQDDDGEIANANAYIDADYFNEYFLTRAIDISDFEEEAIEGAIVSATDYIDNRWFFRGTKLAENQTTEFPRADLLDRYTNEVIGLPSNLKKATAEYARQCLLNDGLTIVPEISASGQQIIGKKEKVGPIEEETTFASGYVNEFRSYPVADALLASYLFNLHTFGVYKG